MAFEHYISMISFANGLVEADRLTDSIISVVDDVNAECREKGLHAVMVRLTGHEDDGQSMLTRFLIEVGPVVRPAVSRGNVAQLARIVVGAKQ